MISIKRNWIFATYAVLLLSTAALKLGKVFFSASDLMRPDAVFDFLTIRELLFFTSILEVFTVAVVYSSAADVRKYALVASLSSCFLLYRLSLGILYHSAASCKCLGLLGEWSIVPKPVIVVVSYLSLLFLMITSYVGLFCGRRWTRWGCDVQLGDPLGR